MPSSGSTRFFTLYKKELLELRPELLVVSGLALLLVALLLTVDSPYNRILVMPLMMLMGLAGLLPVVSSFKLGREWNTNSIYLLLSLPVKGAMVLGARLAALLTQYLIGILVTGLTGLVLVMVLIPDLSSVWQRLPHAIEMDPSIYSQIIWGGVEVFLLSLVFLAYVVNISFFSQVTGKLVKRFSGLLTAVIFFVTLWLTGKGMQAIWEGLYQVNLVGHTSTPPQLMAISILVFMAVTALVFILTTVIYDRRVEL